MTATPRRRTPPKPWDGKGVDTETFEGWARLVCTDDADCWLKRGEWRKAVDFLVDQGPRLIAWNLRFDAEAILKHLPREVLERLLMVESVNVGPVVIDILPWKQLRFRTPAGSVEVYDVAPFFTGSLDRAAKRFLGQRKKPMDAKALNVDPKAWENRQQIVDYCRHDASLTHQLADFVSQRYLELGGSFDRPYSAAYVAADMLLRDTTVRRLHTPVTPAAEEAMRGARFECWQRGRFEDLCAYDIKSAYPSELLELEDADGRWITSRKPHPDALHAIVRAEVMVPEDEPYPPIPLAQPNKPTIYPTGTFEAHVLLRTWQRHEPILRPIRSWSYIPKGEIATPYEPTVQRLLDHRAAADAMLGDSAKRAANSVYGKLLNIKTGRMLARADDVDHLSHDVVMVDGEPHRVVRKRTPGVLYNPLHAGIVTEGIRLRMEDAARKVGDRLVGIQADGILTDGPALGTDKAQKVGDLGFVARGDGISCGSGLYEIRGYARRTRGVTFGVTNDDKGGKARRLRGKSWFGILRGARTETVSFTDHRPVHLSEAIRGGSWIDGAGAVRNLDLKDVNVWLPFTRNVNVCRDQKRDWEPILEARRLLREQFRSTPISTTPKWL